MAEDGKLHVVTFPWLAFGHLIPFLEFSNLIAQKGHKISFVSTPRNIDRLPKVASASSSLINFIKLPLPHLDSLPENAEATIDVPYHKLHHLKTAFDGLQTELTQFLKASAPDWVIYDFAPHWLPPIASELGISRAFFSLFNAWTGSFFGSSITDGIASRKSMEDFTVPPEWVPFPSTVAFRLHEIKRFRNTGAEESASSVSDWVRFRSAVVGCDVLLIRTCTELEPEWLELLKDLHRKPLLPVGLLPPFTRISGGEDGDQLNTWHTIKAWLDKQEEESVVYVTLGSEVTPSQDELTQLARGLEQSGLPFFWALRKWHGSAEFHSFELPVGFEERIKGRGIVWTSWAPQVKILAHGSVGGFVTHCGWNSVIEGLQHGRPLLMLPFLGDQGLNARALAEMEAGIEIPRDEEDGSLSPDLVAESLRLVMVDNEGRAYMNKAKEMKAIFGDRNLQNRYTDNAVEYLQKHRHLHKD
ncbi:hypothetical protein RJ640_003913 [Escallonia rubra]|uniref:Glycosyltransferase n=1 Tax=Escallonia rubra TaxID=112253 RepID=A0AA88RNG1_9ASTE|nr:hypothetical protein RJ640_003913 [Escallonia rubra]